MSEEKKAREKFNLISSEEFRQGADERLKGFTRDPMTGQVNAYPNPAYGSNVFDPNAYLPQKIVSGNPRLTDPLPMNAFVDPRFPTPQNTVRAKEVGEFLDDPQGYIAANAPAIVQEQSLLDRGKSMLANLFDYEDDADLSMFGVPLGGVESVWDRTLRHVTGFYDLLSVGFGGLISAAPGGVQTLSYDQLSGNKSVGQVLNGEMDPGSAPSPGQIALTSIAVEAKRIREGKARLSDALLLNPATAPFMLAAIAADTSPLQADDFDLMNKAKRDAAFGQGWEQWMSGVTDAGLMFADPLIGVGVAAKITRVGMLGAKTSVRTSTMFGAAADNAADELIFTYGGDRGVADIMRDAEAAAAAQAAAGPEASVVDRMLAGEQAMGRMDFYNVPRITTDMPKPDKWQNQFSSFLYDVTVYDAQTGQKVMSVDEIARRPEFDNIPNKAAVADLFHQASDPLIASLIAQSMIGTPSAMRRMQLLRPALADATLRLNTDYIQSMRLAEPAKVREVTDMFMRTRDNIRDQYDNVTEQMQVLAPDGNVSDINRIIYDDLSRRQTVLQRNMQEAEYLYETIAEGRYMDPLDASNPYFDMPTADRIIEDLLTQRKDAQGVLAKAIADEVSDAAGGIQGIMKGPTKFLYKDNILSDIAAGSRKRRATARYQYANEGTRILPRKVVHATEKLADGSVKERTHWEGLWTPSTFEGTSRFRRNVRVWRWLGEQTPSGYIGLKGVSTVNAEEEFRAATNLDIYRGNGITIMVDEVGADGVTRQVPKRIGGREARDKMFREFYAALNDPTKDSLDALRKVELQIANDLARAYYVNPKKLEEITKTGGGLRDQTLEIIRTTGWFADPETGDLNFVPYLKSHLANGTYMLNYQNMEKIIRKEMRADNGRALRAAMDTGGHYAAEVDRLFQNVWRPLTLLRFSYTQRNVFEGVIRAMAYQASLAPLTWPVRATTNGVRNAIIKRTAGRKIDQAKKMLDGTEYKQYLDEYAKQYREQVSLDTAMQFTNDAGEQMFRVYRWDNATQKATKSDYNAQQYEALRSDIAQRVVDADSALEANLPAFDASIANTKFGKWRQKNLDDLQYTLMELDRQIDILTENLGQEGADGVVRTVDNTPEVVTIMSQILQQQYLVAEKMRILRYQPLDAMTEYQAVAGRQRRIGSGTSLGPDGGYYADAFTGPLAQINANAMSNDNTQKMTLSVKSRAFDNFFRNFTVKTNQAVPYSEQTRKQWATGMLDTIEDASSNRLVGILLEGNFSVERAIAWMTSNSKDARDYAEGVRHLFEPEAMLPQAATDQRVRRAEYERIREDGLPESYRGRFQQFITETTGPGGQRELSFDMDGLTAYVTEVSNIIQRQMMGNPAFMELLRRRVLAKGPKVKGQQGALVAEEAVTEADILRIVDSMPNVERLNLGMVQGSAIIQGGMDSVIGLWNKFTNIAFKALGTIPEDAIVRGPFYNTRFKQVRNQLVEEFWARETTTPGSQFYGMTLAQIKAQNRRAAKARNGAVQTGTLSHAPFRIPANELSRIEVLAHRQALLDTKTYMYTIDRRTNLGKYGEWIFPFISATQNSVTVAGKLLYKEPWLPFMIADLWRMPNRVGWEDENGNLQMPMPFPGVAQFLADNPQIPFIGGAVDPSGRIMVPKDGFNVWAPDTGFGWVPRPVPWVQVGASEMMKANLFPQETPQILKTIMDSDLEPGQPSNADQLYNGIKDYIFGSEGSLDEGFMSLGLVTPASIKNLKTLTDDLSSNWGYMYQIQRATQYMRYKALDRPDEPTHDELVQRTNNMVWFNFLGSIGLPTPLTPYPILTRPEVRTAAHELVDIYQKYKQVNPEEASLNMYTQFGEWGLEYANTKITENIAGVNPTAAAVGDVQKFTDLIRKVTSEIPETHYDLIGMLVNNRSNELEYDQRAYDWLKTANIPGTTRKFREIQSPEESLAERQRVVGWTMHRQAMDMMDARLASAGFKSYEAAGALPLKQAKDQIIANMMTNPELKGWAVDYEDFGGSRTQSAIKVMESALMDANFVTEMTKAGKERLLANMHTYLSARNGIIIAVEESGKSINDEENYMLKLAWANIRQDLKNSDERWASIADQYLTGDDNPSAPGDALPNQAALATVMGVSGG